MVKTSVYIPVSEKTRERIIKKKGALTYDAFFNDMMEAQK